MTKTVLITGAARRIGAAIAELLHAKGMNIVLHYHTSKKEATQLCKIFNKKRPNSAIIVSANLLQTARLDKLVKQAVAAWGRLDVLVNNASQFYKTPVGDVTEHEWDDLLGSNLKAPFFLAQAAAPYLAKKKGCIINIGDVHTERSLRDYPVYCISKAGLIMLTKALAKELAPAIRVNAVSPNLIVWPEGKNKLSAQRKQKLLQRVALQRQGNPEDIAKAVLFLVLSADYVTGQVVTVDGGRSLFI